MRRLRPARPGTANAVAQAIRHLKAARDALEYAGCPRTLARVRRALTSAYGAQRHAYHREHRT